MGEDVSILKRQIWDLTTKASASLSAHCTPFTLPSNGVLSFGGSTIKITTDVVFRPECTGSAAEGVSSIALPQDPFYASTIPQTYAIAAAAVIAWILVVMLIITPRTNFLGQSGVAPSFSNGHGIIGGATGGGTSFSGVGSRPWLQKIAALTVAVSLTIASADSFEAARDQYLHGVMNATSLRDDVLGSLEIRVTRVISDVFVWLAQVQTLIRLFPRHKEKVLIKWIGFALILFDAIFSCLNYFMIKDEHQPRDFVDAIPALSYLFELALGLLYAAWVIYYSLTKRRYAYYHQKMRSISLIAALSFVAILTPVVFFVTDVSNPDVAGWGDYFRWVGAAAASVVVWEWVERIEALERDERKDGILGREIFDGDEMLDVTPSEEVVWAHQPRQSRYCSDRDEKGASGNQSSALEQGLGTVAQRVRHRQRKPQHFPLGGAHSHIVKAPDESGEGAAETNGTSFGRLPKPRQEGEAAVMGGPTPPPAVASPVSRADTASAASTMYVVQYDPTADIPQPVRRRVDVNGNTEQEVAQARAQSQTQSGQATRQDATTDLEEDQIEEDATLDRGRGAWHAVTNPFKRKRASPPAEVQQARQDTARYAAGATTPVHNFSRWDIKNRLGVLAAETSERLRDRTASRKQDTDLPLTVIPAQPRGSGRAWTPAVSNEEYAIHTAASAGGGENSSSPGESSSSNELANDDTRPGSHGSSDFAGADDSSRLDASGTRSSPLGSLPSPGSYRQQSPPADHIRPISGQPGPSVVHAPSRSVRSSPLATHHANTSTTRTREHNETYHEE